MGLRIRRRFLWAIFLVISAYLTFWGLIYCPQLTAIAKIPPSSIQQQQDVSELEAQARQLYALQQFHQAIAIWQQVAQVYTNRGQTIEQAKVLSNIALAYGELGDWQQAGKNINLSLRSLNNTNTQSHLKAKAIAGAQILNNQGILNFSQGKLTEAITNWQEAGSYYQQVGDRIGVLRTAINQASAFKQLGLYRRATKILEEIVPSLEQQPDSPLKATALRSYGDVLRLVGNLDQAKEVGEQSLAVGIQLDSILDRAKSLSLLGDILLVSNHQQQALETYQQGLNLCATDSLCWQTNIPLKIHLAQLNLILTTKYWQRGTRLLSVIQTKLNSSPLNRRSVEYQLNFAHALIKLRQQAVVNQIQLQQTPSWQEIEHIINSAISKAKSFTNQRAESYGWGLLGQIYEQQQQWQIAQEVTAQALIMSQVLNAPEISYLWQWQLGRISQAQGARQQAIAHYSQAVELLKILSLDLVVIDPELQYSFRDSVEPVYRGLVSLLLDNHSATDPNQANLLQARDVIESLQLAELNNFFREACLDAQPVTIDRIDRHAAVIYPIILPDRLAIILSLPGKPLTHYVTKIPQEELEQIIEEFRVGITIRSRRQFYEPAQQLYNWLIRPAAQDLQQNGIQTIVFVPDGSLRNIPLTALYDGQKFLIEDYSVSLNPGLQLLTPRPLKQIRLKTIAAGLTQPRQGFSSLDYVDVELSAIQHRVKSTILLDQDFTTETLQQTIQLSDYPIVHIATHGQFSSSLDDTFLLAWDDRINIHQLDEILQTRNPSQEQAIELLVLSACETATGDRRAALGLAGIAVKAGARSTLATLWSVNDAIAAKLMSEFYHQLTTKSIAKSEAIRQAQLKLLHSRDREHQHPYYWAPYVLLGNWL